MPPRVKICGITRLSDALVAVEAGADALGFMFYEGSPRNLTFYAAAEITSQLPPFVCKVGVFVNPSLEQVNQAIQQCRLDAVQLHGTESPKFAGTLPLPVIKAFRVQDESSLNEIHEYQTSAWLLDAYTPGKLGGTGETFNWALATKAKGHGRPIILAGGLTAANVGEAIRAVKPYGVDISSGVESAPGIKDPVRIRDFIQAVHSTPTS